MEKVRGFSIRKAKIGDMGHIIARHGVLYEKEYGFDAGFEQYVLLGIAKYIENYDPALDRIWVAECDGRPAGFIAIVHADGCAGQLRWFLVEPEFRGLGVGRALVEEAVAFCRPRYRGVFLWTLSCLPTARHLYQSSGLNLVEENTHHIWGKDLTQEKWELNF